VYEVCEPSPGAAVVKGRELSDEAIRYQAEAFLIWSSKRSNDVVNAFERWAATKDFVPADLAAILVAIREAA
jgi:hypothetical protein